MFYNNDYRPEMFASGETQTEFQSRAIGSLLDPPSVAGSPTSEAAARSVKGKRSAEQRDLVYRAFERAGVDGLTDEEGTKSLNLNPSSYRPRRRELELMGLVVRATETRKTESGREAQVFKLQTTVPLFERSVQ